MESLREEIGEERWDLLCDRMCEDVAPPDWVAHIMPSLFLTVFSGKEKNLYDIYDSIRQCPPSVHFAAIFMVCLKITDGDFSSYQTGIDRLIQAPLESYTRYYDSIVTSFDIQLSLDLN